MEDTYHRHLLCFFLLVGLALIFTLSLAHSPQTGVVRLAELGLKNKVPDVGEYGEGGGIGVGDERVPPLSDHMLLFKVLLRFLEGEGTMITLE